MMEGFRGSSWSFRAGFVGPWFVRTRTENAESLEPSPVNPREPYERGEPARLASVKT
jgi:hypothetical protein